MSDYGSSKYIGRGILVHKTMSNITEVCWITKVSDYCTSYKFTTISYSHYMNKLAVKTNPNAVGLLDGFLIQKMCHI